MSALPNDHEIIKLLHSIRMTALLTLHHQREEALLDFCQHVFQRVFSQQSDGLLAQVYQAVLVSVRDLCKSLRKELTTWVIYDEQRFNRDIVVGLLRSNMLSLPEYDHYLSKVMDGGNQRRAVEFVVAVLRRVVVVEKCCEYKSFPATLDALAAISARPGVAAAMPALPALVEAVRAVAAAQATSGSGGRGAGAPGDAGASAGAASASSGDPAGLRERVLFLLETWMRVCQHNKATKNPVAAEKQNAQFLQRLQQVGVLASEQATDRFFRVMTELCVESCLSSATAVNKDGSGSKTEEGKPDTGFRPHTTVTYAGIDAMSQLVLLLVKYAELPANKVGVLTKVLNVASRVLLRDSETTRNDGSGFDQRPYFRLFLNILHAVNNLEPSMEAVVFPVHRAFANIFHALNPARVPSFAFAWLELISHRTFMPKLLLAKQQKGWALMHRLVVDLFVFMQPYLRNAELNDAVRLLYVPSASCLCVPCSVLTACARACYVVPPATRARCVCYWCFCTTCQSSSATSTSASATSSRRRAFSCATSCSPRSRATCGCQTRSRRT